MSVIQAKELLEKYWAAETSIEEENQLRQYHKSGLLSGLPEGDLFDYYDIERSKKPSKDLTIVHNAKKGFSWRTIMSIAASFLIIASVYFNSIQGTTAHKVIDNPEQALEVTMTALSFLNGSIDRGEDAVKEGLQQFDKTRIFKFKNSKEI